MKFWRVIFQAFFYSIEIIINEELDGLVNVNQPLLKRPIQGFVVLFLVEVSLKKPNMPFTTRYFTTSSLFLMNNLMDLLMVYI